MQKIPVMKTKPQGFGRPFAEPEALKTNYMVWVPASSLEKWKLKAERRSGGLTGQEADFSAWVRRTLNAVAHNAIVVQFREKSLVKFKPLTNEETVRLQFRVSKRELEDWRLAADSHELSLAEWIRQSLDWVW